MRNILSFLAFILPFTVYLVTLAPSLTLIDSGELIMAADCLGNPHSPGYPTYTMLGKMATFLPLGNIAYRVSLLSALCGAGVTLLLYWLLRGLGLQVISALSAAWLFAFSLTYWSLANMAEVYCSALLVILLLFFLALWEQLDWQKIGKIHLDISKTVSYQKRLCLMSFLVPWGLGLHHYILFALPSIVLLLIATHGMDFLRFRLIVRCITFFILGFSTHLYLPLRAAQGAPYCWELPDSFERFYGLITTQTFHAQRFVQSWPQFLAHYDNFVDALLNQFTPWLLPLAVLGLVAMYRKWPLLLAASLIYWIIDTGIGVTYFNLSPRWFNTLDVFFVPGHLMIALWMGIALDWLLKHLQSLNKKRIQITGVIILSMLPLLPLLVNYHLNDQSGQYFIHDWAVNGLQCLPENAMLIMNSDEGFVLWNLQVVERYRQDVAIVYYETFETPGNWTWRMLVQNYPHHKLEWMGSQKETLLRVTERTSVFTTFYESNFVSAEQTYIPFCAYIEQINMFSLAVILSHEMAPLLQNKLSAYIRRSQRQVWRYLPTGKQYDGSAEREYFEAILVGLNKSFALAMESGNRDLALQIAEHSLELHPGWQWMRQVKPNSE